MTASRPERVLPVEMEGHLRLDAPSGRTLDLIADGDTLRLDVPGWRDLTTLVPRSARPRGRIIRVLGRLLVRYDLTLRVECGGATICQIGSRARPNWLARLLGLAPARIPLSAILFVLRR